MTTSGRYTRYRLPRATGKTRAAIYASGGDIAVGPDGALWFTEPLARRIWRMTTAGQITGYRVPADGDRHGPFGIAAGTDGSLWFTTGTHFGLITTSGHITLWRISAAQLMTDVVAANNGTFWVTDPDANIVFHITPTA
jgi:virginiamycin B lyase